MENNRYREEEKELEQEQTVDSCENEVETKLEEDDDTITSLENELEEAEDELKKDNKLNKKLKKKIKHLEEENAKLIEQIKEINDQLLRNRADLENFKRRTNEERLKERKYAMQDYFTEIIDVIDVFDKTVSVKTDDEKLQKYLNGFAMINTRLKQSLENYGVKKIDSLNQPFNPTYHQAIEVVEKEGVESNIVVEVIMEGYLYKDRVLRPSMVKVSK